MNDPIAAVNIVLMIVNVVGLAIIGLRVSGQATDSRVLERRLTMLESEVKHLPTHRDLIELRNGISEVVETVAELNGQAAAMTTLLRTIQEHLLENDR